MNGWNVLRRSGLGWTLFAGFLVAGYLFPVYWMAATSLKTNAAVYASPPQIIPWPPILSAYREAVWNNPLTLRSILNSAIVGLGTMLLTLVLAAPAAYALARLKLRGATLAILLLLITQLLPAIVIATPLFVVFSRIGLINSYPALILANTTFTLPFAVILLRPFFLTVPRELEAAAQIDGCTQFGAFARVILPLVQPGLLTVAVFAFLMGWGEFLFAMTLTTNEMIQPATAALNKFIGQYGTEWNKLMAVATTIAIPIIIIFASLQRYIVSGLTTGAVKE
ncbi:carbohydrate ABC transporter permease [Caldilinea sp.]|jgi:multiple sugar transport system permease protein|uniref:carbohydrate ABC transporter permease n=1 Tax=Caldilinea sp. TaxID=2293560 RepID=UPI0021DF301F|nr:carbohydrate ABC transporter permease [uncultured Caldilinea sp.]GIV64715.1 MAG: sugar ABC transporter permease [Bellilinea sp.]